MMMMMASINDNHNHNNNNNNTSVLSSSPATNEDDYLPNATAIQGVDSEDVEDEVQSSTGSLFQQWLHKLSNSASNSSSSCSFFSSFILPICESISVVTYKSCVADKREEFEWRLPHMLLEIKHNGKHTRTPALQKLYRLVDREHADNRIVAMSGSTETIAVLLLCLKVTCHPTERRTALLILNNLCIPVENKVAILYGNDFINLMTALLRLIQARTPTAYLAIVTLVNLSNTPNAAAKRLLFEFIPLPQSVSSLCTTTTTTTTAINADQADTNNPSVLQNTIIPKNTKSALDEPTSCIRTLESILRDTMPYRYAKNSVEHHCCKWAMNVIRNLVATCEENGLAVAKGTVIPELAVTILMDHPDHHGDNNNNNKTKEHYANWTRDSLPDAALMVLVHLAKDVDCVDHWRKNVYFTDQVLRACDSLMASGSGLHAARAAAVKEQCLDNDSNDRSVGYSV